MAAKVNYDKGLIYCINAKDTGKLLYVGSTTSLRHRIGSYKSVIQNKNNITKSSYHSPIYKYIRENGGWDNIVFTEYMDAPSSSKQELERKENEVILELQPELNVNLPRQTREEYLERNRDLINERQNKFREENRDHVNQQAREYGRRNYLDPEKKERILERGRQYKENNKEAIKERKSKPEHCAICGCDVCHDGMYRHIKSMKHINNMERYSQLNNTVNKI
jgi:hypothetical protein